MTPVRNFCFVKFISFFTTKNLLLGSAAIELGAKGLGVLHHLPNFRPFFQLHKFPQSSVISGTFSHENRFPPKPKETPENRKTHQARTLTETRRNFP